MKEISYTPGAWFGVVRSGTAVLLSPETDPALVAAVWELLARHTEAHEVLHEVTDGFGVSLSRIPPFGIIDATSALRVFLRGDLELAVTTAGKVETVHGRDVTTWTERRFDNPESYLLGIPAARDGDGRVGLPLGEGVVMLSGLGVGQAVSATHQAPAETVLHYDVPGEEDGADLELTIMPSQLGDSPDSVPATDTSAPAAALEFTSNYDHLWDKTVMRSIEDAAVRVDPNAESDPETNAETEESGDGAGGTGDSTAADNVHHPEPAAHSPELPWTPPSLLPGGGLGRPASPNNPAEQRPGQDRVPTGGIIGGSGLIDSVPWGRPFPGSPADSAPGEASHSGQTTPANPVEIAADPDHDGQTVMKGSLGDLSEALGGGPAAAPEEPPSGSNAAAKAKGPLVLGRVCGRGHANPPTHAQCAACGESLTGDAVQVSRPSLGKVRLSTGDVIDLDQSLIIGRQPSVSRVQGGAMPKLVQVASPGGDISRSHVEVRLEGWHVMLCDLKATNGTVLVREGQAPRRLAQSEMAILLDGDIAELGDGVSLRFEEIP
ncbi:FHA domain-containing protein [Arthrobacter sp. M4]|uniref:FHA domain-containing protein n=1 Tax=Arthrobacter sp. M4 TaxID=218160 RepID=UPI001CDD494E|nr:FHA domain-containing protein [Arthrobacter sp. M4]MCA4133669.1 hypothetical protein [Arthrobacter sp. M4]